MELHNYGRGVLHVVCPDAEELAYAFLRIQESSCNPRWKRRKTFIQDEFLNWYNLTRAREEDGRWEYHREYVGFSVESRALVPFYEGRFDPISSRESRLLKLLEKPTNRGKKIAFVIGSTEGDSDTMRHELSRALSYTDKDYNQRTLSLIKDIPGDLRRKMDKWFIDDGSFLYSIIPQEIVAEFADWEDSYMFKEAGISRRNGTLQRIHGQIIEVFEEKLGTLKLG